MVYVVIEQWEGQITEWQVFFTEESARKYFNDIIHEDHASDNAKLYRVTNQLQPTYTILEESWL